MKKKIVVLSLVILFVLFANITFVYGNEKVDVTTPKFNVRINGFLVDNQHNKYPMIMYKDITYLPLVDGYCNALGIETSWNSEKEFVIETNFNYDAPKQDLSVNNDLNEKYNAEIANFKILIDGEEINNYEEEYPILFLNNTVYIPLTWRFANEFFWNLFWDNEDGLSVVGDAPDVYDTCIVRDWIYYREDYTMYKMKLDGSEKTKFADAGESYQMIVSGDWIYYINASDDSKLYKIKVDGTNKTKLSDGKIEEIVGVEDSIYYVPEENYSYDNPNFVYKMNLDGSGASKIDNLKLGFLSFPILKDGWFYYKNEDDDKKLYKVRTNGQEKTKLSNEPVLRPQIVGEWVYYVNISDNNLYKVKIDGSNSSKVLDEKLYYYIIEDGWLYYGNEADKGKLYKIKLDGTGKTKLNDDDSVVIDVIDGWAYYEGSYGVHMSCFLKLARTDINTGITENIMPNGPEKFYYLNGVRIEGQNESNKSQYYKFNYNGEDKTTEELAQLSDSVVLINTYDEKGQPVGQGSGVVISDDGLIVTNLHVLSGGNYIGVVFEDREGYEFSTLNIINVDVEKDLAIIKLYLNGTMAIKLGDSDNIEKGEEVVAIGNPYGLENTISDGIISGIRNIGEIEIIQTTTPISPGSSGGALLNMKGELLGITSMVRTGGQNLNFAIPSKYINELLEDDTTKMNLEISKNLGIFKYNDATLVFDGLNHYQGDKYLINLIINNEIKIDFDIFASSEEFRKQIEEFYIKNIQEIAKKYGVEKYDFNLYAGRYVFSYKYNDGKIKNKKWNEDKDLRRSKVSKEKVLRINLEDKVSSLDPQLNSSKAGFHVINNMFEGLMREEDGKLKYGIAKKYTVSEDGRTYTFHLRNAKWSDGKPVKASDFEYSWKRALDPNAGGEYSYLLLCIEGAFDYYLESGSLEDVAIKAIDDKTLRVTLNEPMPEFPRLTTLPVCMPVRKDIVEENPDYWYENPSTLVCNGPFKMEEYKEGYKLTLVKNNQYYDSKSVKLDKIEMYMINDYSISTEAFEADEFDIINYIPSEEEKSIYKGESVIKLPSLGVEYYVFNVKIPEVNDVNVRKALSLAIDRKYIVEDVLDSTMIPATGFIPYGIYTSKGEEFRELAGDYQTSADKADIDEARELLAEAGYPDGKDFPELVILYNETERNKAIAEAIKLMWEKNLNIKVRLEGVYWTESLVKLRQGDFIIGRAGWIADYADPINFLRLFASASKAYNTNWSNSEYDKLIQDSYSASEKERDQLFLEAEKILMDEMVTIPLWYFADTVLIKDYIKDWQTTGLGYWYFRSTVIKK